MYDTKACNLTEKEVKHLLSMHGHGIILSTDEAIERINYLNKRLKAFKEVDTTNTNNAAQATTAATGWGSSNNG